MSQHTYEDFLDTFTIGKTSLRELTEKNNIGVALTFANRYY